jgi:PAS domain S-box-containing protein
MITDSFHLSLLERAIAASSNGIVIADAGDPDRPIIYCNPAFEKLSGYSREEVIGRNCRFLQGPDTDRTELNKLRSSLQTGTEIKVILKNYRKDKTTFWNELTVSPVRDTNGKLTHFIGIQNDITQRVAAETALRVSEAKFQKLAANIPGMIYQFQLAKDGRMSFPYVSSGCRELYELEPEVLENSAIPAIEMIHPDDLLSFQESVALSAKTLEPWGWEGQLMLPGGQIKWVRGASRPEMNENGDIFWDGLLIDISDRKLAEASLRQSEAKFQQLAANVPGMIYQFLLRPDGSHNFIYVSHGCRELYELEPEEILNNSDLMWSAVHSEDRKLLEKSIAISGQTLKPWKYEGRIVTKSGQLKWIRGIARPEKQPDGDILWDGLTIDISDRKQAEIALSESKVALQKANQELEQRVKERTEALQRSQQMLWLVINNIPQFIVWKDRSSVFLGCNQNFVKKAGFNHSTELVGLSDLDMPWKAEETESFRACDRRIIKNNSPEYHIIEPQMQADGTQRWIDANKIPLHDNYGNAVGILYCFEDITDRLALEEKVRTSEELFRKIFEDAPIGIDLANLENHQLVQVNKAYCEMLGYTESELLGKTFRDIVHPDDVQQNIQAALALDRKEIRSYQTEKRLITATGKTVWANVTATLIRDSQGKPIYNLGMIENITDRKISEAALQASEAQLRKQADQLQQAYEQLQNTQIQLVHSEKMSSLGQMVAGIAHEINNPATFIKGNIAHAYQYFHDLIEILNLYERCYPSSEPQIIEKIEEVELEYLKADLPKMLDSMMMGVKRINQIVLSLRNFARLDEAEMKLADIHEGIESTLLILQHRLNQDSKKSRIEIVKEYGKLPRVNCCAGQLNQVFLNILNNAIDALEKQKPPRIIAIRTEFKKAAVNTKNENQISQCDRIVICIADSGPGMTVDVRKHLFDPFFTTKPVGSGTGLGLSISYQIVVEKHRGTLRCISAPGQGAEFWIEIPL